MEATLDALSVYYEKVNEFARASEPLIAHAIKLKDAPEWDAFKQILLTKIARDSAQMIHGAGDLDERERGKLEGMKFVIDLLEIHLPRAMDKKKTLLLRKQGEDNNLTEDQQ